MALTLIVRRVARRIGPGLPYTPSLVGVAVHDVLFVLLTIGVFAFLALCAKGAEKL